MMGGVSPETCWASYKYEIKFWYTVASCWIFFVNYTMMHGSTNIKHTYNRSCIQCLHADALGFNATQYMNCVTGSETVAWQKIPYSYWFQKHVVSAPCLSTEGLLRFYFSWTFLTAYSTEKMESNTNKASQKCALLIYDEAGNSNKLPLLAFLPLLTA